MEDELKQLISDIALGYLAASQEEKMVNAILTLIRKREIETRIDYIKNNIKPMFENIVGITNDEIKELEQQLKEFN